MRARRLSGAVIGIAGSIGAMGGVLINLAFRQSFLVTKSGVPAFWFFLGFYGACVVVTYVVYLRGAAAVASGIRGSPTPRSDERDARARESALQEVVGDHDWLGERNQVATR